MDLFSSGTFIHLTAVIGSRLTERLTGVRVSTLLSTLTEHREPNTSPELKEETE